MTFEMEPIKPLVITGLSDSPSKKPGSHYGHSGRDPVEYEELDYLFGHPGLLEAPDLDSLRSEPVDYLASHPGLLSDKLGARLSKLRHNTRELDRLENVVDHYIRKNPPTSLPSTPSLSPPPVDETQFSKFEHSEELPAPTSAPLRTPRKQAKPVFPSTTQMK